MEINITHLVEAGNMMDYSASVAESNKANIGEITWQNAMNDAMNDPVLLQTAEQIQEAKVYFKGFGAWESDEILNWTDQEVNALLLQFIAGDIREAGDDLTEDYEAYQKRAEEGQISGNIYKCDIEGHQDSNQWFIYIGF